MAGMPLEINDMARLTCIGLQRRRAGAIAMALVALLALLRLRSVGEAGVCIASEVVLQSSVLLAWLMSQRRIVAAAALSGGNGRLSQLIIAGLFLVVAPWVLQLILRWLGHGTGVELVAMSSFAWGTLLASMGAKRNRSLGTSVICSGFMTLIVTCSSDQSAALLLATLWGGLCLWWLASSQWERVQRCEVSTVTESSWQRPLIVLAGGVIFILSAWSVAGRFPPAQRLPWEIAPTSGGTGTHDEFARSGVGDGDALVAARENAASFGAVDSDLVLDSKEASLFDLYSDAFGEPVRKQDVERTIALAPQQQEVSAPSEMAQSDGASSGLTTQRRATPHHEPLANRASEALLFWIGRPNTHLALEHFSSFDGLSWHSNDAHTTPRTIRPIPSGNRTWFTAVSPIQANTERSQVYQGALAEAIKFARLKSPRIPTPAGMHSWHVHQVDDASFFQVDANDDLSMPGRKSVPEYTIVRYVGREIDLQSLTQSISDSGSPSANDRARTTGQRLARQLVEQWVSESGDVPNWNRIDQVVGKLRERFQLDRAADSSTSVDPLAEFFERRAGSDLMFATAAAVMLGELGYQTRLVTGLVARAENRLGWTKELAVYAQDTHAWLEIQTGSGDWIPLEPSPGYPLPVYRTSWRYWLMLNAWRLALALASVALILCVAAWQRVFLFECAVRVLYLCCCLATDRQRCQWLITILDLRGRLVGFRRPEHVTPARWYSALSRLSVEAGSEDLTRQAGSLSRITKQAGSLSDLAQSAKIFFQEADRMWFGSECGLSQSGREACRHLWQQSHCRLLKQAMSGKNGALHA